MQTQTMKSICGVAGFSGFIATVLMFLSGFDTFTGMLGNASSLRLFVPSSAVAALATGLFLALYTVLTECSWTTTFNTLGSLAFIGFFLGSILIHLGASSILVVVSGSIFGIGISMLGAKWIYLIAFLDDMKFPRFLCISHLLASTYLLVSLAAHTWIDVAFFPLVTLTLATSALLLQTKRSDSEQEIEKPAHSVELKNSFNQNWMLIFGLLLCIYILGCTWSALLEGRPISNNPSSEGIWGAVTSSYLAVLTFWIAVRPNSVHSENISRVLSLACVASFLLAWFIGDWTSGLGRFFSNMPLGFALASFGLSFCLQMHREHQKHLPITLLYGLITSTMIGFFLIMIVIWPMLGDETASVLHLSLMVVYLVTAAIFAIAHPLLKGTETQEGYRDGALFTNEICELYGLTVRESEILKLLIQGRSAPYIAGELYVSINTIKTHMKRIYQKTGVHSREELLDLVHEKNLDIP